MQKGLGQFIYVVLVVLLVGWDARAQQPGLLDAAFNPVGVSGGKYFSGRSGNKLLVSGGFLTLGAPVNGSRAAARFNEDGTIDASFNFPANPAAYTGHVIRSDGRILLYGSFTSVGGHPTKGVVLVGEDGSVDTSFRIAVGGNEAAVAVESTAYAAC